MGRTWNVAPLNLNTILALKSVGVDLCNSENAPAAVVALCVQYETLADVAWTLCRAQAESQGVDRDTFNSGLDGEALAAVWGAIHDAYLGYVHSANRDAVEGVMKQQIEALADAGRKAAEAISSPEAKALIGKLIDDAADEVRESLRAMAAEPALAAAV
jgi:hypothetical protein